MKILFTDLDDTLLNNESKVSEYSKSVLRDFVSAGNLLVPTSGRPLKSVVECIKTAGIDDLVSFIIAYNGALIYNTKENTETWSAKLSFEDAKIIQEEAFIRNIHFQTYADEHIYTPVKDEEIITYTKKIHLPVVYTPNPVEYINKDPYKALAIHLSDKDELCKLRDTLNPLLSERVNIFFSNNILLEFVNKYAGKGIALVQLCSILNIPIENSFAAGDQENDISMLKASGCGIAVSNAIDAVKSVADVITDFSNNEDGLARFISNCI